MQRSIHNVAVAVATVAALASAACTDDGSSAGGDDAASETGTGPAVTVLDPYTGTADATGFEAVIAAFEEEHPDVDVRRRAAVDFDREAIDAIESDDPPDIVIHPRPGLIRDFVNRGAAREAGVDLAGSDGALLDGAATLGSVGGAAYGVPLRLGLSSLVWYPPGAFAEAGYEVPETYDELLALTERIAGDIGGEEGRGAWCVGVRDGPASGWPATDWVEDAVLRAAGPDVYDQWVNHEVLFASDQVESAITSLVEPIWFGDGTVAGGPEAIVETSFSDAALGLFESPPSCLLHRQAGFIRAFFPDGVTFGEDVDAFLLPPSGDADGPPAVVTADLAVRYTENERAVEFLEFALSRAGQEAWLAESSFLSPRTDLDADVYRDAAVARQAELLADAGPVRLDASEQMPGVVGAGAFWDEMLDWLEGAELRESLEIIDAAWPDDLGGPPTPDADAPPETPPPSAPPAEPTG